MARPQFTVTARLRVTTETFGPRSARGALAKAAKLMETGAGVTIATTRGVRVSIPALAALRKS